MISLTSRRKYAPSSRFSITDRFRKIPRPSGAWAIPFGTRRFDFTPWISWLERQISPERGFSIPEMARSVLVFPAPLAPMSATTSPCPTESDTPRSAVIAP